MDHADAETLATLVEAIGLATVAAFLKMKESADEV